MICSPIEDETYVLCVLSRMDEVQASKDCAMSLMQVFSHTINAKEYSHSILVKLSDLEIEYDLLLKLLKMTLDKTILLSL